MSYKMKQVERGNEAIEMLRAFLETKGGLLTVSVHESKYSSGSSGYPDLIFNEYGIEVKRVEILAKKRFNKGENFYKCIGWLKIKHESWNTLKEWSKNNGKIPMAVAVLTTGSLRPIFLRFTQKQIDQLQKEQKHKVYFGLSFVEAILKGEIWK